MTEMLDKINKPELVTLDDVDGLDELSSVYESLESQDVLLVREDVVPEAVERSQIIAERIRQMIGAGRGETKLAAVLAVSAQDRELLEAARRLTPNVLA